MRLNVIHAVILTAMGSTLLCALLAQGLGALTGRGSAPARHLRTGLDRALRIAKWIRNVTVCLMLGVFLILFSAMSEEHDCDRGGFFAFGLRDCDGK